MEEDIDTRKINNSFLRDHSYATEGNARAAAFRRWAGRELQGAELGAHASGPRGWGWGGGSARGGGRRGAPRPSRIPEASPVLSSRWTRRPRS